MIKMLCQEFAEIKAILKTLIQTRAGGGNTITCYPLSPETMTIPPREIVKFTANMNRPLQNIGINAPDGVEVSLYNNNELVLWKSNDHGALDLPEGMYIGNMLLTAENKTNYPLQWSVTMVWGTL